MTSPNRDSQPFTRAWVVDFHLEKEEMTPEELTSQTPNFPSKRLDPARRIWKPELELMALTALQVLEELSEKVRPLLLVRSMALPFLMSW